MGFIGNGEGHTLLILTDAESRAVRERLGFIRGRGGRSSELASEVEAMLNAGIMRGTAKLQEEFKAEQQARKKGRK